MALVALPGEIVLSESPIVPYSRRFQLISWSHIEILAVASLEPQRRSRPCCRPDLHPTAESELKRRDDAITRTKHRAPTYRRRPHPPPPGHRHRQIPITTTQSTTPRRCTPSSGESAPRPACFPAHCPATLAPAHVPSFICYTVPRPNPRMCEDYTDSHCHPDHLPEHTCAKDIS